MKILIQLFIAFALIFSISSCQKYNQIDNTRTIKTPYTLFIGTYNGAVYKTNDALYFSTLRFIDNSTIRQLIVADSNIIEIKQNCYYSKDDGKSFKDSKLDVLDFLDPFYKYYIPNPAVYDRVEKKVYLCTKNGLTVSTDLGATFNPETNWSPNPPANNLNMRSLTQLDNGTLYLMGDSANQYYKQGTGNWTLVAPTTTLPRDTIWYVSHSHDTLFAIDFYNKSGVYYSVNLGVDWKACTGLPKNKEILFGNRPFGSEAFYVGLDSGGLYRLNGTTFQSTGAGIPWWAKVSYVEGKRIIYRTDVMKYYLFCATDLGLYISESSDGKDWKVIKTGLFSTLF
ncbi:MAG: hypothetical protein IPL09_02275 [Bacteroidetes bacterium]|jgi:hypothetical protein|nr:hypothetical protein [Bacteroidota bacterium]MBK6818289.1 hypothetical protein [Bacteroidota bacterium]MBK7040493.1 hypothetical protein [Bacteroidota bacterium]MBK7587170.1 hypothetical protein [Bacteroidota bacterium]MBK8328311.1 hypothetical protein [Bacteroidota bacterium]